MSKFRKHTSVNLAYTVRFLIGVLVFVLVFGSHSTGGATGQDVYLEIFPPVIQLFPNKSVDTLLVIRNPTPYWLQDIQVLWYSDVDVELNVDSYAGARIQPEGSLALNVHISQKTDSSPTGSVYLQIDYLQTSVDDTIRVSGVAIGKLEIQEIALETVDKMVQLSVETALEQVEEQRPGQIFLVVHNLADVPITIDII